MLDGSRGMAAPSWEKWDYFLTYHLKAVITYEINTPRGLSGCCLMVKAECTCRGKPPAWDKALGIACIERGGCGGTYGGVNQSPSTPALSAASQRALGQATFYSGFFFHCFPTQLRSNSYKGYVQTCTKWRLTRALGGFPRASLTEII